MAGQKRRHVYIKHPEFNGIGEAVWDALNEYGRSIPKIKTPQKGDKKQQSLKDNPIWHTKKEVDRFVARRMNLKMADYGRDLSRNPLYKAIAGEIAELRDNKILIDWRTLESRNTGIGVWRLNKTKLVKHEAKRAVQEMNEENFHASSKISTVYVRTKQNKFREILYRQYHKCLFCGFKLRRYVVGAHIVPYSIMKKEDSGNAMNPANGLLLCRLCDVAFEHGSIMMEEDYGITIRPALQDERDKTVRSWLGNVTSQVTIGEDVRYKPLPKFIRRKKKLVGKRR